jgi:hypothetical protein
VVRIGRDPCGATSLTPCPFSSRSRSICRSFKPSYGVNRFQITSYPARRWLPSGVTYQQKYLSIRNLSSPNRTECLSLSNNLATEYIFVLKREDKSTRAHDTIQESCKLGTMREPEATIKTQSNQMEERTKSNIGTLPKCNDLSFPCPQTGLSSASLGFYPHLRPTSIPGVHLRHAPPPNSF